MTELAHSVEGQQEVANGVESEQLQPKMVVEAKEQVQRALAVPFFFFFVFWRSTYALSYHRPVGTSDGSDQRVLVGRAGVDRRTGLHVYRFCRIGTGT